jgi:hypothetical protein
MGNTKKSMSLYRRKIDDQGNYLPFPGYTIVTHAVHPLPKVFTNLVDYLSQSELRHYYSFLPARSYHVTINPLENVHDEHQTLLQEEQRRLKDDNTSLICTVDQLICAKAIHLEVHFDERNAHFEATINRVRSHELQQANILHGYKRAWHLTLAYQYKNIESTDAENRIKTIIEQIPSSSHFPFDIQLDSIRICRYEDMTEFRPI